MTFIPSTITVSCGRKIPVLFWSLYLSYGVMKLWPCLHRIGIFFWRVMRGTWFGVCTHTSHVPVLERWPFFPRVNIHFYLISVYRDEFSLQVFFLLAKSIAWVLSRLHEYAFPQRNYRSISLKEAFFLLHYIGFRSSTHSFSPLVFANVQMSLFSSIFMSSVRPERDL